MELTKEEKRIAVAAYRKDSVSADPHAEVYAAVEAVLEARAASDQGLRKAAQEAITKIESTAPMIYSVVFLSSPAKTPWDILGLLPCAQALKAALARQVKDGPVLGEERPPYKKCGKVAQTFIAREGSYFPCALEEGHQGPCLQSGECFRHGVYFGENCPHWPKCADQLLAPRREPSHPMSGTMQDEVRVTDRAQEHDYTSTACYHGLHDRCRKQCKFCSVSCRCKCHAESTQEPPSQQEVFGDNESSRFVAGMKGASARAAGFPKDAQHGYAGRNAGAWVDGWEYCNDCLCDPNFKPAPASVQPSTDDVVERMLDVWGFSHDKWTRLHMAKSLAVAREGWVAQEKAEQEHLQTIDERNKAEQSLSHAYFLITGRSPEWSNLFGHEEALEEIDDAQTNLREEIKSRAGWHPWAEIERAIIAEYRGDKHRAAEYADHVRTRLSQPAEPTLDPAVEAVMELPELNGWDEVARRSAAARIVEKVRKADAQERGK